MTQKQFRKAENELFQLFFNLIKEGSWFNIDLLDTESDQYVVFQYLKSNHYVGSQYKDNELRSYGIFGKENLYKLTPAGWSYWLSLSS